jgi:hypothetical protein
MHSYLYYSSIYIQVSHLVSTNVATKNFKRLPFFRYYFICSFHHTNYIWHPAYHKVPAAIFFTSPSVSTPQAHIFPLALTFDLIIDVCLHRHNQCYIYYTSVDFKLQAFIHNNNSKLNVLLQRIIKDRLLSPLFIKQLQRGRHSTPGFYFMASHYFQLKS